MEAEEPKMYVDHNAGAATKRWMLRDGSLHREDGPAIEYANGSRQWYQHNHLHRTGAPAVETINGGEIWYQHGKLHRTNGPAVVSNAFTQWWVDGVYYEDITSWAKAALQYEQMPTSPDAVDAKVAQVMQHDLFS